jgi:hypothetical protein
MAPINTRTRKIRPRGSENPFINIMKNIQRAATPNLRKRRVMGSVPAAYANRAKIAETPKEIADTIIRKTPMRFFMPFSFNEMGPINQSLPLTGLKPGVGSASLPVGKEGLTSSVLMS